MGSVPPESSGLGSLAQSARGKHLKQARGILIAIGVLTIVVNAILFALIESQVKQEIDKEVKKVQTQGRIVDQAKRKEIEEQAVRLGQLMAGGTILLGVVFVVFGIIVNRYPVPVTILSLVLYVASGVIFWVLNPESIAQGIIIKVIIVVALIKAVQAAIAYQKEQNRAAMMESGA
jgi:hypothetical protein